MALGVEGIEVVQLAKQSHNDYDLITGVHQSAYGPYSQHPHPSNTTATLSSE